jgi:hypothetical protein
VLIRDCSYSNLRPKTIDLLRDIVNWYDVSSKSSSEADIHNVWVYLETLLVTLESAVAVVQYKSNDNSNDHVKQPFTIFVVENCEVYVSLFNILRRWKLYKHTNPAIPHLSDRLHRLQLGLNSFVNRVNDDSTIYAPHRSYCIGLLLLSIEALL